MLGRIKSLFEKEWYDTDEWVHKKSNSAFKVVEETEAAWIVSPVRVEVYKSRETGEHRFKTTRLSPPNETVFKDENYTVDDVDLVKFHDGFRAHHAYTSLEALRERYDAQ